MVLPLWRRPEPREGGLDMVRYRLAALAAAVAVLAAGTGKFTAAEPKDEIGKGHDRLEALAAKLGLSNQQKEEMHKIHADFQKQAEPIENQLWALHHAEYRQLREVLKDEQRSCLPEVLKAIREREFQAVAAKLGLSDEQKQQIEKVREDYAMRFHDLIRDKQPGENVHKQFRELRRQFMAAIRPDLNDEQRALLPVIMHEEYRYWHNPEVERAYLKAVGDKLGLTPEQKEKVQKICAESDPKIEKLDAQLKTLHDEEHAAFHKALTPEQRTKLRELRK
jgi:hypothetical protein